MAQYTPRTWTTGDTITAAELNAIEAAAAAAAVKADADAAYDAKGAATAAQAAAVQRANHTGTQSADSLVDGTTNKAFLATERTKLTGIATGATAYTDAQAVSANAAGLATKANIADVGTSGTPTGDALRTAYVAATPPAALTPWYTALANRDNAPAVAVMIGASGTEGQGATDYTKRWTYRMQTSLRARFPNATTGTGGGIGFLPPKFISTTMTQPATVTGALSAIQYGLGRRALILAASGNAISWTLPTGTTSFDLSYANGPNGTATVAVDGSTVTTLTSSASYADGPIYHATVTPGSAHTVSVTWASGSFPVDGIRAYAGDENCGIHILDAGHFGWNSTQWNFNDNSLGWAWSVSQPQPALVNIALGLNDEIASTSSATFKTNLLSLITYLRTAPFTVQPAITLDTQYKLQADGTYAEPWANYIAVMQQIAAADPTVAVIDSAARMPGMSPDAYGLWNGDGAHPSNKGHALLGEYHAALLAPR